MWFGKKPKVDGVVKSVNELQRSMAQVAEGITETRLLMQTQQRSLDELIRSNSYLRVRHACVFQPIVAILCQLITSISLQASCF